MTDPVPTGGRLTDAQIEHYRRDGYVVPDLRLPEALLERLREDHARLVARHPEFVDYCPAVLAFEPGFLEYARMPALLDLVEQLLGPDIALWNSSLFAKPALRGRRTPWHQDGEYWPIRPLATCTVWIAIDAANRDNGCLRVIPGSHRAGTLGAHTLNPDPALSLPLELDAGAFDTATAVDIELQAGQVSLHDVYLAHGSEPNRSPRPRRALTLRYMPTASVYRRDLARSDAARAGRLAMSERTLYLMRGRDTSGHNDFRVRY